MKKIVLLFITCITCGMLFGQAQRMILIEEATNASCGPCASQNPAFNELIRQNDDRIVAIKYQWYFPGFDPMHEQNVDESLARVAYYGINGVPTFALDGRIPSGTYGGGSWTGYAGGPYGMRQAVVDFQANLPTPLEMKLTHQLSDDFKTVDIKLVIKNLAAGDFKLEDTQGNKTGKVQVALIERDIVFDRAPGSNGEKAFEDVMRKMIPDHLGTVLETVPANDSIVLEMNAVAVPDYIYNIGTLAVVAFVQDDLTKTVFQAARSNPNLEGYGDVALTSINNSTSGICSNQYQPSFTITNDGYGNIDSFSLALLLDDVEIVTENYVGTWAPGQSMTFNSYPVETLSPGTHKVELRMNHVNGNADYNPNNEKNALATFGIVADAAVGTEMQDDFEATATGDYPTLGAVNSPLDPAGNGGSTFTIVDETFGGQPMGGYGTSNKSMLLDFYDWEPGDDQDLTITFGKFDLSGSEDNFITFDRAGARRDLSNDRMFINISTDCGNTWEEVYDEKGRFLATVRNGVDTEYYPSADEWVTDEIPLGEQYDNATDVLVQFVVRSDNGNYHYLDNIRVGQKVAVGSNEVSALEGKVEIFPNPTNTLANIKFELVEATEVNVDVYNVDGKLVTTLLSGKDFGAGNHIVTWKGVANTGVYLVKIKTNQGEITKKVTVF